LRLVKASPLAGSLKERAIERRAELKGSSTARAEAHPRAEAYQSAAPPTEKSPAESYGLAGTP